MMPSACSVTPTTPANFDLCSMEAPNLSRPIGWNSELGIGWNTSVVTACAVDKKQSRAFAGSLQSLTSAVEAFCVTNSALSQ